MTTFIIANKETNIKTATVQLVLVFLLFFKAITVSTKRAKFQSTNTLSKNKVLMIIINSCPSLRRRNVVSDDKKSTLVLVSRVLFLCSNALELFLVVAYIIA